MAYSLETIIKSLENRIAKQKSGYIKMGFEGGKLVGAAQYNSPTDCEKNLPKVQENFSLKTEIEQATKNTFYGTLGFVFSDKKITNCYKSQSWKGSTLELFIGG